MADEVNLALARIYERNCPGRIIGKSKGVFASPRSVAPTTVVLGGQQLTVVAERLRYSVPVAGTGTRTMQSDHRHLVSRLAAIGFAC